MENYLSLTMVLLKFEELLILYFDDPIDNIASSTYINLKDNCNNEEFIQCSTILVSIVGTFMSYSYTDKSSTIGEEKEYISLDSVDMSIQAFNILSLEFLSSLSISGIPNHEIKSKI
ncbi:hypothetical protein Lal_00013511 [Lupinus albus]|nr:hypothetical protein Lal_00013511 [Lupinus albus]